MASDDGVASPGEHRADEFIDDRALERADDDRFGYTAIAGELAEVALTVRTPANIALFGPWGSGKTTLANLLRKRVESDDVAFVHFDAFKYAETPLRRHFISQAAKQLRGKDSKIYEEDLYRTTKSNLDEA